LDKEICKDTIKGTPQEIWLIISATLINFTLNGLEKTVKESIKPLTAIKEQRMSITQGDGTKIQINVSTNVIRYADDFVVITRSLNILEKFIKPAIEEFLKERGL
jgi:RNA-directed DNA polymerase